MTEKEDNGDKPSPPPRKVYPPRPEGSIGNYSTTAWITRSSLYGSQKYHRYLESKIEVVEDFGEKVRVKHLEMHNCNKRYEDNALEYLNDEHQLIHKRNIKWKDSVSDIELTEPELEKLVQGQEIDLGGFKVKLAEGLTHNDILDAIIKT